MEPRAPGNSQTRRARAPPAAGAHARRSSPPAKRGWRGRRGKRGARAKYANVNLKNAVAGGEGDACSACFVGGRG